MDGSATTKGGNISVIGNKIKAVKGAGIKLRNQRSTVVDNTIFSSAAYGIRVYGQSKVNNNRLQFIGGNGIELYEGYSTIRDNYISSAQDDGILINTGGNHNIFRDNIIINYTNEFIDNNGSGNRLYGNMGKNGAQYTENMYFTKLPNASDYPNEYIVSGGSSKTSSCYISMRDAAGNWAWYKLATTA
jgi:hypothetical protein